MQGIKTEFQGIWQNKKMFIALIGISLMPLLYGGLLIWSFWDPYGQIEELPVAVVNEDTGAEVNGEPVYAGNDLEFELKQNQTLNFDFVDKQTATEGMKEFDYYFYVEIPENFSKDIASVMNKEPVKATLYYEVNNDYNYVSSQIANNALSSIENELSHALTLAYAEVANDAFSDFTVIMHELEEGALQVADGNEELHINMEQLSKGILELEKGSGDLHDGLSEASAGGQQINQGFKDARQAVVSSTAYQELINQHDPFLKKVQQLQIDINESDFNTVDQAIDDVNKFLEDTHSTFEKAESHITDMEETLKSITSFHKNFFSHTDSFIESIEEQVIKLEDLSLDPAVEWEEIDQQLEDIILLIDQPEKSWDEIDDHLNQLPEILNNFDESWEDQNEISVWFDEADNIINDVHTSQIELKNLLTFLQKNVPTNPEQMQSEIEDTLAQLSAGVDSIATIDEEIIEMESQLLTSLKSFESTLGNIQELIIDLETALPEEIDPISLEEQKETVLSSLSTFEQALVELESNYNEGVDQFNEAHEGVRQLANGLLDLEEGSDTLSESLYEAFKNSQQLEEGSAELKQGANDLLNGIHNLTAASDSIDPSRQHELMVSSPVQSKTSGDEDGYSYGEGLAPYFLSIGLYVGALTLSIIYPFRDPLSPHVNGQQWFIGKLSVIYTIGFLQTSFINTFLLGVISLDVQNIPGFIFFTYFTSFVFLSLVFGLVAILDNPGRFIAIILLILQLGGSAGTFPVELLASPLQTIHGWLPMTYSVLGFRAVIFMDSVSLMLTSVKFLIIIPILLLALTFFFFKKKFYSFNTVQNK